jgi:hypothetical protein
MQRYDDMQASVPSSPASPESVGARMIRALRLASLRLHAKRMFYVSLGVLAVGAGVSVYFSQVGTKSCTQTSAGEHCVHTSWYPLTVQKRAQLETLNGVPHGKRVDWYSNGVVWLTGEYTRGVRTGQWEERWPNGAMRFSGTYTNDVLHGTETWWYENGAVEWQVRRKEGVRHGQEIWWHPNGNRRRVGTYEKGERHGEFSIFTPEGNLAFRVEYKNGTRLSGSNHAEL